MPVPAEGAVAVEVECGSTTAASVAGRAAAEAAAGVVSGEESGAGCEGGWWRFEGWDGPEAEGELVLSGWKVVDCSE